jgi:DNA polymerase III gamma/tau subunit
MENFIVSARKYRPGTFKTIVGQSAITTTLKNAVRQNQVAQAFLFCGPRGVGKTTCARILAKTVIILQRKGKLATNVNPAFRLIDLLLLISLSWTQLLIIL